MPMKLMPDIEVCGHVFSMQSPYTMDGNLIEDVADDPFYTIIRTLSPLEDMNFDYYVYQIMRFSKISTYISEEQRSVFNSYLISNNGHRTRYGELYCDETGKRCFDTGIFSYLDYITKIKEQVERYRYSNEEIKNDLNRLKKQNRLHIEWYVSCHLPINGERYHDGNGLTVANNSEPNVQSVTIYDGHGERISSCDMASASSINVAMPMSLIRADWYDANTQRYLWGASSEKPSESINYIHEWNYKPEYIYHHLAGEYSPLLLGAEIEVAGNTNEKISRNDVVKECIQIMNNSDSCKEDLLYSTYDSSVQIELDTMPCSLNYHKTLNYKKMFKYLDEQGYKGHDCEGAGLHIHANRTYLGDTELKQQVTIAKILYILEKFNDEVCVIARRNNRYSEFVGKGKDEKCVMELYGKYKDKGKHVALNLSHENTIEFRCFRSTLKYETFILTLEFVQDIIDFAKSVHIEDIEDYTWYDIMDRFSSELVEYYDARRKKEIKEKRRNVWNHTDSHIDTCVLPYEDLLYNYLSVTDGTFNSASGEYRTNETNEHDDEIKQLKKNIKNLKRKIKYANNPLERQRLQKELDSKNKELKKLKRNC